MKDHYLNAKATCRLWIMALCRLPRHNVLETVIEKD